MSITEASGRRPHNRHLPPSPPPRQKAGPGLSTAPGAAGRGGHLVGGTASSAGRRARFVPRPWVLRGAEAAMSAEAADREAATSSRPCTPPQTSWFEFLLEEDLLEQHLRKPSPGACGAAWRRCRLLAGLRLPRPLRPSLSPLPEGGSPRAARGAEELRARQYRC